jgi:hypothetical protein
LAKRRKMPTRGRQGKDLDAKRRYLLWAALLLAVGSLGAIAWRLAVRLGLARERRVRRLEPARRVQRPRQRLTKQVRPVVTTQTTAEAAPEGEFGAGGPRRPRRVARAALLIPRAPSSY